jgi:hypothetical protein
MEEEINNYLNGYYKIIDGLLFDVYDNETFVDELDEEIETVLSYTDNVLLIKKWLLDKSGNYDKICDYQKRYNYINFIQNRMIWRRPCN